MSTRKSAKLTLTDKLSRLSLQEVNDLLGTKGKSLINAGGKYDFDLATQVNFDSESFVLTFLAPDQCRVTLMLSDDRKHRLLHHCSSCPNVCEHVGAAYSLILEEKTALGLAIAPDDSDKEIAADLTDEELVDREIEARRARAKEEKMRVRSSDPKTPWADYQVSSKSSGKTWRVALRGMQNGESYCSCPDYRKNTLGICKHIFHVQKKIAPRFSKRQLQRAYKLRNIIVHLQYQGELSLRLSVPEKNPAKATTILKPFLNRPISNVRGLVKAITKLEQQGITTVVYPDAEEYIQQQLEALHLEREISKIRSDKHQNYLGKNLLKVELLPYQLEGILFAANAGRAILADDMGLGKTIQGIGTAELLANIINISKVLVICPASLKAQWRAEITRFCERECQIIVGPAKSRASQYNNQAFFTICNYEQVLRDILPIEQVKWDLIILDEGHRIKNWEAKTSQIVKSLRSSFALVLSGTPMENRLDELYSVAEFINERRLGPGFRFYNRHRIVDEKTGKIIGYKNLAELRENLQPILLRRTRASVLTELPPRTTDIIRITPTDEQVTMHTGHMQTVLSIVGKRYISEMDLLRLQKALLMCRMCANSTELVNKQSPGYSSKLEHLNSLLPQLAGEADRKVVLFSEWTGMHKLIEAQLKAHKIGYVRLDGSVAQQKRAALVKQFRDDPSCRFFLATNAGSTGLNLQFANTLVNVDLPWTPAILEQRIGRIHRMGQTRPVQVYILITESTLEENLLGTLAAKHELSLAALDANSDIDEVELVSGMEALKRRLEVLLGAKPEAPVDVSQKSDSNRQGEIASHRERMAVAGGQLMGAAFEFMDSMLPQAPENTTQQAMAKELQKNFLECVTTDEQGQSRLTITLPNETTLTKLSETIARMMASGGANDK